MIPPIEPYSFSMTVSRLDKNMRDAVNCALYWAPTEANFLIDTAKIVVQEAREKIREIAQITTYRGQLNIIPQVWSSDNIEDHHDDVIRNYHQGILYAKYNKVFWCDDDDRMLINPQPILKLMKDNVALVYGHVTARGKKGIRNRPSQDINSQSNQVRYVRGSVQLWNRDLFRTIYQNIDIYQDGPRSYHHGYFADWKMYYWLARAGYELRYVDETFCFQNINDDKTDRRTDLLGKWDDVLTELNQQTLIIDEMTVA